MAVKIQVVAMVMLTLSFIIVTMALISINIVDSYV